MESVVFNLPWDSALAGMALLLRASAFVAVAPVAGSEAIPARMRIALAVLIVFLVGPVVPAPHLDRGVLLLVSGEVLAGALIGFAARLIVEVGLIAGDLVGYPTGMAMAAMFDPVTQMSVPTLAVFYRVMATLVYLAIGGHQQMIAALVRSYEILPAGTAQLAADWFPAVLAMTGRVIALGFRLSAPVLAAGFLVDIFLLLVARAAPQMNILVVGAPVRLLFGLLAVAFSLQMLLPLIGDSLEAMSRDLFSGLSALAGRP